MTEDHTLETDVYLTSLAEHIFVLLFMNGALLRGMTKTDVPFHDILNGYDLMAFKDYCEMLMTIQAFIAHVVIASFAEGDGIFVTFARSALGTLLQDCINPTTLGVVIVYEFIDHHIDWEIIDSVQRQLRDLPAEWTDHVIKILV